MTKRELITKAKEIQKFRQYDRELFHMDMDELLLKYLNLPEIESIYKCSGFWYS